MHKRFDIVALGEGLVEFNQTRPDDPTYLQGFGGDTSNAVIAAARAGARTAYVSAVGDDHFGQMLMQLWLENHINTAQTAIISGAYTGIYFVTHDTAGHEFNYRRAGSAAAQMVLTDEQLACIGQAKILHLSGISLAISQNARSQCLRAIHAARAAGAQVSFDSNLRLKLWSLTAAREAITEVMALTDIFLPSMDDVTALSGLQEPEKITQWAHRLGAKTVVLKLGADGVLVSTGQQQTRIPALRVQALDATGAGDCFGGNLLARLCQGDDVVQAARYANAAAALAVQGFGAVAPLPYPQAVVALLQTGH